MTLQQERQAILDYINEKNPGPIIRQACENRIKFLSIRVESQGRESFYKKPCFNIKNGKVYKSVTDAAIDINVGYNTLIGDIYRGSFTYGIRPLIFS